MQTQTIERAVESALAAGIDLLWIGARTTVNPFSVQELANALRGTSVPKIVQPAPKGITKRIGREG